jgi:tetratricopeptide (TPR) repeat protein
VILGQFSSVCAYISRYALLNLSFTILAIVGSGSVLPAQTAQQMNQRAVSALAAGKIDAAVSELQIAARRFPADVQIQFNLGLALVRAGKLTDAIPPLERASKDESFAPEAHFLLGTDYFESRNYEKAIAELQNLQNSPHAERVLYLLEESNRLSGHTAEARDAFREINRRFPESAWTHFMMASAYESQHEPEKAIDEYRQALQTDPAIPNANFAIGYLYFRQQDSENAREWLLKEAQKGCHSLANFYLGEIARADKEGQKAEALYRRAIECDSSNGDAHLRLGLVLGDQKRYQEAIAQLKEAIRCEPNESSPHYHLASLYRRIGRTEAAEVEYKKVREIQAGKDTGVDVTGAVKR